MPETICNSGSDLVKVQQSGRDKLGPPARGQPHIGFDSVEFGRPPSS